MYLPDPNERHLLTLLKSDDEKAIEIIFKTYHALLCRIAFRIINDKEVAKDIVQEVFIKFWNSKDQLEIGTSLKAYLRRATINTSLNYIEKHSKALYRPLEDVNFSVGYNSTEVQLNGEALEKHLIEAINTLPPRCKAIFTLSRFEELTHKEIAFSLNISVKAVEKEIMKALKLLRQSLSKYLSLLLMTLLLLTF